MNIINRGVFESTVMDGVLQKAVLLGDNKLSIRGRVFYAGDVNNAMESGLEVINNAPVVREIVGNPCVTLSAAQDGWLQAFTMSAEEKVKHLADMGRVEVAPASWTPKHR